MKRGRKSNIDTNKLVALINQGKTIQETAAELGIFYNSVRWYLVTNKIPLIKGKIGRKTKKEKEEKNKRHIGQQVVCSGVDNVQFLGTIVTFDELKKTMDVKTNDEKIIKDFPLSRTKIVGV